MLTNRPMWKQMFACVAFVGMAGATSACDRRDDEGVVTPMGPTQPVQKPVARQPAQEPMPPPQQAQPQAEPITAVVMLFQTPEPSLVGRTVVTAEPVRVSRVVSDKVFFVRDPAGQGTDRELLVYLDEVKTPGTPTEGRYDINPGDMLTNIQGIIRPIQQDELQSWGLDEKETQAASERRLYLHANKLTQRDAPQARK